MEFLKRLVPVLGGALFAGLIGLCLALELGRSEAFDTKIWVILLVTDVLLTGMMVFVCVFSVARCKKQMAINEILNMQVRQNDTMYDQVNEIYDKARTLNHDMKAYLVTILGYLENGRNDLAYEKLVELTHTELSTKMVCFHDSPEINAVLNEKLARANKDNIIMDYRISGNVGETQKMPIAVILSNLLDNAIEAEQKVQSKKIDLEMMECKGMYYISVMNAIEQPVLDSNPELHTTKPDKQKHGLGIKSVRRMVRQLQGSIQTEETPEMFRVYIAFPLQKA